MAQAGLHGLAGLVVGQALLEGTIRGRVTRPALLFGYVVGNILPDFDYLTVVAVYPINPALALSLHRGFSHSLLAACAVGIGFWLASVLTGDRYQRFLGYGLTLGMLTHSFVDLFLWFSPIDLFWPASLFGWLPPVNLWSWYQVPVLFDRMLTAAEFAAYALYFDHLAKLASIFHTNPEMVEPAERMATVSWITWALATALELEFPAESYILFGYLLVGTVFFPTCLYLTWRMQETVERLGLSPWLADS